MERISVAIVGIEAKDLTVLRSLLNLVAGSLSVSWQPVEQPQDAQLAFLGHGAREDVEALARLSPQTLLVHCGDGGDGLSRAIVTARCPPRSQELARIFTEVIRRNREAAALAADISPAPSCAPEVAPADSFDAFDADHCLAGAIHAMLPRLLMDQPLLVTVADAPPLLVDVHSGLRTVHGDPAWFSRPDFWRTEPDSWKLVITPNAPRWAECRCHGARPYPALRFWGVLSASRGKPVKEVARSAEIGLKKLPDFKALPHQDWHRPLAGAMVEKRAPIDHWMTVVAQPREEVVDFLNGCSVLGLLKQ